MKRTNKATSQIKTQQALSMGMWHWTRKQYGSSPESIIQWYNLIIPVLRSHHSSISLMSQKVETIYLLVSEKIKKELVNIMEHYSALKKRIDIIASNTSLRPLYKDSHEKTNPMWVHFNVVLEYKFLETTGRMAGSPEVGVGKWRIINWVWSFSSMRRKDFWKVFA